LRIIAQGISENRVHIGWLDAVGILPLWFGTGSQRELTTRRSKRLKSIQ
jgi:hypothetical protein